MNKPLNLKREKFERLSNRFKCSLTKKQIRKSLSYGRDKPLIQGQLACWPQVNMICQIAR